MDRLETRDKTKTFVDALKRKYKRLYEEVCPIPYMRDNHRSVNSIFIDSCIEKKCGSEGEYTWTRLSSYTSIFEKCQTKCFRRFIQGQPGHGKSTLCLQLAYDWSNGTEGSPVADVEILVILRLRQFGKTTSLWEAIKLFLVPVHPISIKDIEEIIQGSSSVKIILDGHDEYLENDDGDTNQVDAIISGQTLQNVDVTITSRYSPNVLHKESQVFKLTGFDACAREAYIRKAIVDDDEELKAIKDQLEDNAVLAEFCSIPLIFVMFAHVAHEKKYDFRDYKSVTGIFRLLISCFHDHLRNKLCDDNVKNLYRFENDHTALDKLAFEGLAQNGYSMSWTKTEIFDKISKELYDCYVTLGILVIEEAAHNSDFSYSDEADNIDVTDTGSYTDDDAMEVDHADDAADGVQDSNVTTTKVRFYQNIFSEWYAAHHLAYMASTSEMTLSNEKCEKCMDGNIAYLGRIDPSSYIYRFACGLRPSSTDKIINYLRKIGHENFASLCSLENSLKDNMVRTTTKWQLHFKEKNRIHTANIL